MTATSGAHPGSAGLPGLRSLDHIALTVPNLQQAVDFFCAHFGAHEVFKNGPFDGDDIPARLNVPPGSRCELVTLRLGDTTNLELFHYQAPAQRDTPPRNSDAGGHHLAFYVDDIEAARAYLAQVPGVRLMHGPNDVPDDSPVAGQHWFYFLSPWGLQMEATTDSRGGFYDGLPGAGMVPPAVSREPGGTARA